MSHGHFHSNNGQGAPGQGTKRPVFSSEAECGWTGKIPGLNISNFIYMTLVVALVKSKCENKSWKKSGMLLDITCSHIR